ncbi:ribosome-associated translation inhibitor RaiA [Desulfovibrio sp. OttesenSCG-928-G15]|nr:ribosome-associated translation inhibitor RaiA [Desulfovibrio sp. OttesenSCG-928-G15]
MNIALTFKNFDPSDHLRQYAKRRFEKLGRFLHKSENVEMTAVLTVDKFRHKADVQLSGDGVAISAVEQSQDMYATVDMVLDKLETQLKKHAERMKEKRRSGRGSADAAADVYVGDVQDAGDAPKYTIQEETVEPKPMFPEEAVLQLEQRDDPVLLFLHGETDRLNLIYKRKQGVYSLIDLGSVE